MIKKIILKYNTLHTDVLFFILIYLFSNKIPKIFC